MKQPITWKNVSAPNFEGAARMQRMAAQTLASAFESANGVIGQFQDHEQQGVDLNTQDFKNKILQRYQTPEALQAARASGEIDALRQSYKRGGIDTATTGADYINAQIADAQQRFTADQTYKDAQTEVASRGALSLVSEHMLAGNNDLAEQAINDAVANGEMGELQAVQARENLNAEIRNDVQDAYAGNAENRAKSRFQREVFENNRADTDRANQAAQDKLQQRAEVALANKDYGAVSAIANDPEYKNGGQLLQKLKTVQTEDFNNNLTMAMALAEQSGDYTEVDKMLNNPLVTGEDMSEAAQAKKAFNEKEFNEELAIATLEAEKTGNWDAVEAMANDPRASSPSSVLSEVNQGRKNVRDKDYQIRMAEAIANGDEGALQQLAKEKANGQRVEAIQESAKLYVANKQRSFLVAKQTGDTAAMKKWADDPANPEPHIAQEAFQIQDASDYLKKSTDNVIEKIQAGREASRNIVETQQYYEDTFGFSLSAIDANPKLLATMDQDKLIALNTMIGELGSTPKNQYNSDKVFDQLIQNVAKDRKVSVLDATILAGTIMDEAKKATAPSAQANLELKELKTKFEKDYSHNPMISRHVDKIEGNRILAIIGEDGMKRIGEMKGIARRNADQFVRYLYQGFIPKGAIGNKEIVPLTTDLASYMWNSSTGNDGVWGVFNNDVKDRMKEITNAGLVSAADIAEFRLVEQGLQQIERNWKQRYTPGNNIMPSPNAEAAANMLNQFESRAEGFERNPDGSMVRDADGNWVRKLGVNQNVGGEEPQPVQNRFEDVVYGDERVQRENDIAQITIDNKERKLALTDEIARLEKLIKNMPGGNSSNRRGRSENNYLLSKVNNVQTMLANVGKATSGGRSGSKATSPMATLNDLNALEKAVEKLKSSVKP